MIRYDPLLGDPPAIIINRGIIDCQSAYTNYAADAANWTKVSTELL